MCAKSKQARISNPRILGLLVLVASLFYLIDARSIESERVKINDRLDVKTHRILISSFAFKPDVLNVSVGDKIIWINKDFAPHNITKNNFKKDMKSTKQQIKVSPNLMENGRFELTVKEEFDYYCGLHPSMTGKIKITE